MSWLILAQRECERQANRGTLMLLYSQGRAFLVGVGYLELSSLPGAG